MSELSVNCFNESSVVGHLRSGVVVAAVICVAALSLLWLVEPPAQAALILADPTETAAEPAATKHSDPTPTAGACPTETPTPTATVAPTATASPDLVPTSATSVTTPAPERSAPTHVVAPGETLTIIAAQYGTSTEELAALNGMVNPDLLYVGQEIELPPTVSLPEKVVPQTGPTACPDDAPYPDLGAADELLRGRWIDVDLSEQRLTAYEASRAVRTMLVSTGLPQTPTPVGQFRIWIKLRYDDMAGADYYIEDVPFVMYFHEGYGLHGVTWHGNFGHRMSHGCVNLPTEEAEWLYGWADVGTLVNIHR